MTVKPKLEPNQAQIHYDRMNSRTIYEVYRPDGYHFVKLVRTFMTEQAAVDYCTTQGWEIVK